MYLHYFSQENVVMFAFCGVDRRETHHLETLKLDSEQPIKWQFRCKCKGLTDGASAGGCSIHLWLCPRHSEPSLPSG